MCYYVYIMYDIAFYKKQHYKLFGCHDSASTYKQMSDFNKILYIFKTVTTFLLPKQDSICATHAIFWRFCLITLSHRCTCKYFLLILYIVIF